MDERKASRRGAAIAGGGLLTWLVVLGTQDLPIESKLLLSVLMAMPLLALGARVEADGDVASHRRKWVLGCLVGLTVIEVLTWEAAIFALWILSPLIALIAYIAAGTSTANRHSRVRGHS
jgi:hypothetical protein